MAFADSDYECFGLDVAAPTRGCPTLYVLDAKDAIDTERQPLVPEEARPLASHADPIPAVAWSPDGTWIAYLVEQRVIEGNYAVPKSTDLWIVRADGADNRKVLSNAIPVETVHRAILSSVLEWTGGGEVSIRAGRQPDAPKLKNRSFEIESPDRTLVAARVGGIDTDWICIRAAESPRDERSGLGCFGDGFFSFPEWAP